jgi:hypothetical protein
VILIDEPSPRVSFFIAKNDSIAVGDAADASPFFIAEPVPDRVVLFPLGTSAPDLAELVAETDVVAVAESVYALVVNVLKTKEAAWGYLPDLVPPIDHS